jgi:hypothetical protein
MKVQVAPMAEGFLGRWSQRKQDVREGKTPPDLQAPVKTTRALDAASGPVDKGVAATGDTSTDAGGTGLVDHKAQHAASAPTLDDVKVLTADSSFARFVAVDVAPDVRNAAMKKLFADPHYNVMDRLDVYIDDYSVPSVLPLAVLKQMVSARFLKLVDEPESALEPASSGASATGELREVACNAPELSVAPLPPFIQPTASSTASEPFTLDPHHDDTDLRLQPDHAATGQEPGLGTA